jgi:hypothetical protein
VTPEELDTIIGELYPPSFRDPALIPECFALALKEIGRVATEPYAVFREWSLAPETDRPPVQIWAEQVLRRMVQRAKNGVPLNEREDVRG